MMFKVLTRACLVGVGITLLVPAVGFGQGIAGVVEDASGGVLPGVTVEAASPALIEKVRTVVTDDQGQYNIIQLNPGTYTVSFVLPGFSTVRREGIVLTTNFVANVNVALSVGALEETIVVTSQAPIVDTRTTTQTSTLTNEVLEAIPTGRSTTSYAQLIPGISIQEGGGKYQDVGGLAGEGNSLVIHGSRDNEGHWLVNGMPYSNLSRANSAIMRLDVGQVEEFALETSGISAEYREGGVAMNLVGKEGGNRFVGNFFGAFANGSMQGENLDAALEARGVAKLNKLDQSYDWNPSAGGPVIQDKLWYFGSFRYWGTDNLLADIYWDADTTDFLYTPDLNRQHLWVERLKNAAVRGTFQATPKNKFQVYFQQQPRTGFASTLLNLMPEGRSDRVTLGNGNIYSQVLWSAPITSRVLIEAGSSYFLERTDSIPREGTPLTGANALWSIEEASSGIIYNYPATIGPARSAMHSYRVAVSYVTGSHAFKVGFTEENGTSGPGTTVIPRDMTLRLLNGVPNRITLQASPRIAVTKLDHMTGIYANDQWTRDRLTLNLGVRFDYKTASIPETRQPAGPFLPERVYAAVEDTPNWKDISPRLGLAYDLFGDGRTAVKLAWSRYVGGGNYLTEANFINPASGGQTNSNRNWLFDDGDFIPECDFVAPAANGECGPLANLAFGTTRALAQDYDPAVQKGWHVRPFNIEMALAVQHQLTDRVGIDAGYYRRSYSNFHVNDNILVEPTDFDEYCLTTPVDARLPGGGGQQLCGFYDVQGAKSGQSFLRRTAADKFGDYEDVYDGVDIAVNTRLGAGAFLKAGFNSGRERNKRCFAVDSPQTGIEIANPYPANPGTTPGFCETTPPFQAQYKFIASFTLPGDVILAGTVQNTAGAQITATYEVRANQTTLGRLFTGGNANTTQSVQIIPAGTMYGPRVSQVDLRVSKVFTVGRVRLQANFDAFNVTNDNTVLAQRNIYGTDGTGWLRPELVMPARVVKVGFNVTF